MWHYGRTPSRTWVDARTVGEICGFAPWIAPGSVAWSCWGTTEAAAVGRAWGKGTQARSWSLVFEAVLVLQLLVSP